MCKIYSHGPDPLLKHTFSYGERMLVVRWLQMPQHFRVSKPTTHLYLHRFERLVSLAVHLLSDHRGRPNEQFEALTPHVLDENCQVKLSAPTYLTSHDSCGTGSDDQLSRNSAIRRSLASCHTGVLEILTIGQRRRSTLFPSVCTSVDAFCPWADSIGSDQHARALQLLYQILR